MAPAARSQSLALWVNGERVGRWTLSGRDDMELAYDPAWMASAEGRPLSLSLPFRLDGRPLKGPAVANYFEGLLPDSDTIRRRIAERFRTGSTEAFGLLRAIGRDCVGALQLLEEGQQPAGLDRVEGVELDDAAIERHLIEAVNPDRYRQSLDPGEDFRISLAGAQEKDAFLWWKGKWHKPRGTTPTTHIFKLPLGLVGGRRADFSTSVDNGCACACWQPTVCRSRMPTSLPSARSGSWWSNGSTARCLVMAGDCFA